jgi:uncharacterized membrane protein YgcG
MKAFLPLLLVVIIFANCTSSYKSGQTPDDVYFSPTRPVEEYVRVEKRNDRQYRSEEEIYDDRYVRMRLRNRMWTVLDDEYYSYHPYARYNNNYISYNNSAWNRYNMWNCFYNPYGNGWFISNNPQTAIYNKPRNYNMFVFDGGNTNTNNTNTPKGYRGSNPGYRDNTENYRGSGTNAGNFLRDAIGSSGNSKGSSNSSSSSSGSSNSNNNSSSSGSSSSGNAPVRKF